MKRYAVHRAIVCSRSGFFDGACSSPFREAETGIIDLSEDDPEAVEHMVNCMASHIFQQDLKPSGPLLTPLQISTISITLTSSNLAARPTALLARHHQAVHAAQLGDDRKN